MMWRQQFGPLEMRCLQVALDAGHDEHYIIHDRPRNPRGFIFEEADR